jgi:hypothetical protein
MPLTHSPARGGTSLTAVMSAAKCNKIFKNVHSSAFWDVISEIGTQRHQIRDTFIKTVNINVAIRLRSDNATIQCATTLSVANGAARALFPY